MEADNTVCPVCTLYLRPGITLKAHLASHPKQKVIEALVRLSKPDPPKQIETPSSTVEPSTSQQWSAPNIPVNGQPSPPPANHSFIYQQFMSSSSPQSNVLNVNHLGQPYVTIPTVFNPQMMCQPYVYQQQQVIMSSGHQMPTIPRILPVESTQVGPEVTEEILDNIEEIDKGEKDEPEMVLIETNEEVVEDRHENMMSEDEAVSEIDEGEECVVKEIIEGLGVKDEIIHDNGMISISQPLIINLNQTIDFDEEERELGSPCSNASSDYIRVRRDLNKSCQTQNTIEESEPPPEEQKQTYYPETEPVQTDSSYITLTNTDNEVVTDNSVALEAQNVNLVDMDGMNLILNNGFIQNQIIAPVEEFEYNNRYERPRVLMNIGEYTETREIGDESISIDSANIRADEHMPPRGELSGQESNASDIPWSRIQYHEGNSGMSTSCDLLATETWDGSDVSDNEITPLQSRVPPTYDNDTPTVSGYSDPPIQYKCPMCDENFNCPKERRVHQAEKHENQEEPKECKESGSKLIGKKKVKKLVIKSKKVMVKTENNFDNVFTNKLKFEENEAERSSVILESKTQIMDVDKVEDPLSISNPTICTICEAVLPDNMALKQHQFEIHNFGADERYKCTMCNEVFPCEPKYTEHLAIHPLECRLCGKYFYRRQNLQLHMKRHLGIRPYKCTICEKAFLTKQKLDEHKNIHTGEAPIKCNLCDESFRRHSNLVQHKNRHHFNIKRKIKDYICSCGDIFHSKKKLAWHKEIHENKPKACTQCSEKFIHGSSLTRHMRRAHNERFVPKEDRETENVECPVCNGVFLRSSLDVHIRSHSGNRHFRCLICNKDFTTKWNLKLHKWTHASRASKPYKCDQCKGAFIREVDYTAHMNSHKSIRPYTCNYCGAQFIRKYNCQRHVKEHEKVKTFKCQVCGKSFHRSYYLKDHMRVHSGVRPYSCHICGKTSTTKSNHNKHVKIHHAREPVSTEN